MWGNRCLDWHYPVNFLFFLALVGVKTNERALSDICDKTGKFGGNLSTIHQVRVTHHIAHSGSTASK